MTRITFSAIATFVVILFFHACQPAIDREKPVVSVSILPVQYFIDQLTDASVEVNVMVPAGASHATYSPTPGQLRRLSDSDIYFRIGHLGYEKAFLPRLSEINPDMHMVNLSEGLKLIVGEEIDHGDHVHEGGIDPHIWMSPAVVLSFLPEIKQALIDVYPEMEDIVERNYRVLVDAIEHVHVSMGDLADELEKKTFLIFHPALTYLARDYGFVQIAIERHGKEPSPALLRHIINEARLHGVSVIFIQQEFDVRSAELVSQETGASLVQINPLAYDWLAGMNHIMDVFKQNLQ